MSEALLLEIGGARYGGWLEAAVERGMDEAAGSFALGLTERWPGAAEARPIVAGAPCRVLIGGTPVISGHIEQVSRGEDASRRWVRCAGRDAAGDLVDCAPDAPEDFEDVSLDAVAARLAQPFGVPVRLEGDAGAPLPRIPVQPGDTAWSVIDAAARMRGLRPLSDGAGGLLLTRTGAGGLAGTLAAGREILAIEAQVDERGRYSEYRVLGSRGAALAVDPDDPPPTARDPAMRRHRPVTLYAERLGEEEDLLRRAEYEARLAAARARRLAVTVQGWRSPAGAVWAPNQLVRIEHPRYVASGTMLVVASCRLSLGEGGSIAQLALADPGATELLPLPPEDVIDP